MIVNGRTLLVAAPIADMESTKVSAFGVSYGLGEAGYDIRIKQTIEFFPNIEKITRADGELMKKESFNGRFVLASAMELFQMPTDLVGVVHDKSTWARRGLSVFNTVIEPGFIGGLTLELIYHGSGHLLIPAGAGIAQVLFHEIENHATYFGKYQNQSMEPTGPIES